ncbi:Fic family protein [Halarchaeum nitratireducens]|uniref:Fido domain-containing protein n=1 Tax=Halarchaeum nitratireducens TaxID=489913 RepID=A0A830GFR5_9EURY|nr:Fic family protein [Halarchaeum nitratireducens]GGN26318.1 hypothetical protein GCM10009021_30730 [Halarchaeum nitratireducens]
MATHEEIEADYDLKYTGARVASPRLEIRRLLREGEDVEGLYPRAAFLLRKLVTAHVFEDGNKRTAWVTTREFLLDHGEEPPDRGPNVPRVLRKIRRYDVDEIAEWLETGEIDEDRLEP